MVTNPPKHTMMSPNLVALLAGLVGTSLMLAFLHLLAYGRAIESRLPLALGMLVTGRTEGVLGIGLCLHYGFGIAWGFLYTHLILLARPESGAEVVFLALMMGGVHAVFTTLLLMGIAERHPLKSFRERPIASSMAHGVAHLIYGLGVGLTVMALGGATR